MEQPEDLIKQIRWARMGEWIAVSQNGSRYAMRFTGGRVEAVYQPHMSAECVVGHGNSMDEVLDVCKLHWAEQQVLGQ